MTKQEFFKTLMNNQVMPLATIDVMHNARGMYSLYARQRNAPNCTLSRHCDGSKTGQDMHGKYLDWMHEYAVKLDELVDAAHAEALAINETLDIIADDQAEAAIDMDIAVGIAHAEALKENERLERLNRRYFEFFALHVAYGTHWREIDAAHQEALEMDKVYDEANAEPEHIGRGLLHASLYADPATIPCTAPNCRCAVEYPVFEPVILDLRQLYGEALRDYWQFATEEDRAELVEEQHALALIMEMHRQYEKMHPLAQLVVWNILMISAIEENKARDEQEERRSHFYSCNLLRKALFDADHEEALHMDKQRTFFKQPWIVQLLDLSIAHQEALHMNWQYDWLKLSDADKAIFLQHAHWEAIHMDSLYQIHKRYFPWIIRNGAWGK